MHTRNLRSQLAGCAGKADSKVPAYLSLLVLSVGLYVGWLYFAPYWNHRTLLDHVKNQGVLDAFVKRRPSPESVRNKILNEVRRLGIAFDPERHKDFLQVTRVSGLTFKIELKYRQTITVPGFEPQTYAYEIIFDGKDITRDMTKLLGDKEAAGKEDDEDEDF